jgi:hypothetical protein
MGRKAEFPAQAQDRYVSNFPELCEAGDPSYADKQPAAQRGLRLQFTTSPFRVLSFAHGLLDLLVSQARVVAIAR